MTLHSGCAGSSGLDASNHIDDLMLPYLDVCAALDDWLAEEGV